MSARRVIWPIALPAWAVEQMSRRRVFEARVPVVKGNTTVHRGEFDRVDLTTAHAVNLTTAHAVNSSGYMRARIVTDGGARRTVTLYSAITVGDLLYVTGKGRTRATPPALWVRYSRVERLHSVSDAGAEAAGVTVTPTRVRAEYEAVVGTLRAGTLASWCATEQHWQAMNGYCRPAHVFAARWVADHGYSAWRGNPWTWVYGFRVVDLSAPAAAGLARSGALAQVAGAAPYFEGVP